MSREPPAHKSDIVFRLYALPPLAHYAGNFISRLLQVETPMHEAPQISAQLGNRVLLKREDMQKVRGSHAGSSVPQFPSRISLFR